MRDRGIQRHEYSHRYKLEALTVGVCIVRVMSGVGCLPRAGPQKTRVNTVRSAVLMSHI